MDDVPPQATEGADTVLYIADTVLYIKDSANRDGTDLAVSGIRVINCFAPDLLRDRWE